MSRPKNAAEKDILDHKYRYRIDIGKEYIDPPLASPHGTALRPNRIVFVSYRIGSAH